ALQTNIQTAIGAVILTSLFYFIALPIFRRCLHHFPPFIIGIIYTTGQIVRAWSPFLFLTATVTLWSIPPFKALFAPGGALYDWV
ncbi:L-lactate permease, partial [Salmonella enterica subsp. enterica serovar Kentucky]|nr:L-lactate permease [Salmonella enterica subsp. enterica serovar Kentucky]